MTLPAQHPLRHLLEGAGRPALVLHDAASAGLVADLQADDVHVLPVGADVPGAPRRWPAVVLVAADPLSLRRSVSVLPPLGRSRVVAWFLAEAAEPALVVPRPEWPAVGSLRGRTLPSGGAWTTVRADGPLPVNDLLGEVARSLVPSRPAPTNPVVATTSRDPAAAPPADVGLVVTATARDAAHHDRRMPPDVVLTADPGDEPLPEHHVIGRAPALVTDPDLLAGPLDEGLLNPTGFLRGSSRGEVSLILETTGRPRLVGSGVDRPIEREVGPALVEALRPHHGVRVTWTEDTSPAQVRAVAALAMAGVPVVDDGPPARSADRSRAMSGSLATALAAHPDLTDPAAREEHSVRVRIAALREHSALAWRGRLAARAGLDWRPFPSCSVLLTVQRPEDVDTALDRIGDQRGADLEVIVVTRGADTGAPRVAERTGRPVTLVQVDDGASPGAAWDAGLEAASGDLVVTLEAGDWHGPDLVNHLLWARHYSGAALVGTVADYWYDEAADRTVRLAGEAERTVASLAPGAMMLDRSRLRDLAGVGVRGPLAAASLVDAIRLQGDRVYATHGLGHVRRRAPEPHPPVAGGPSGGRYWPGDRPIEEQWTGFRPNRLLEGPSTHRATAKECPA